jgi:EPS-associated MarR family transcriptional regulator
VDDTQLRTLRELAKAGDLSQRELSRKIGLSLGSANYAVNALLKQGYIEVVRFKNSRNRLAYRYVLTPHGLRAKAAGTCVFLRRRIEEYDNLKKEIEALKEELDGNSEPETLVPEG